MFEETNKVLLCSDLFHHNGNVEALTDVDILDKVRSTLSMYQRSPLNSYVPYQDKTKHMLAHLASLHPQTLAVMHGSSFFGNCSQALLDLDDVLRETMSTLSRVRMERS